MTTADLNELPGNLPELLSHRFQEISSPPTPAAWMAAVYLIQEAYAAPLQYRFTLNPAGPYSPQVQGDLLQARRHDQVTFSNEHPKSPYTIHPADTAQLQTPENWKPHTRSIDAFIRDMGNLNTSQLTLMATTHFIATSGEATKYTQEQLTQAVHEIKPHVYYPDIRQAIQRLRDHNLIRTDPTPSNDS